MKAAHALVAALALSGGFALAQSDQNTSNNGAPAPQRLEQQAGAVGGAPPPPGPAAMPHHPKPRPPAARQNSDQNTSPNGAPDAARQENQAGTDGSRALGDPATMNNNGDYLEACKQLGAEARKDCMAQAKRDATTSSPAR